MRKNLHLRLQIWFFRKLLAKLLPSSAHLKTCDVLINRRISRHVKFPTFHILYAWKILACSCVVAVLLACFRSFLSKSSEWIAAIGVIQKPVQRRAFEQTGMTLSYFLWNISFLIWNTKNFFFHLSQICFLRRLSIGLCADGGDMKVPVFFRIWEVAAVTSFLPGKDLGYSLKFESFQFCLLYGGHPVQEATVWTIVVEIFQTKYFDCQHFVWTTVVKMYFLMFVEIWSFTSQMVN